MLDFTPLESGVLNWIVMNNVDPALTRQLLKAVFVERTYTGVGSFTTVRVPEELARVGYRSLSSKVCPIIRSPDLDENGAMSILFFRDGMAETLEMKSFCGPFPRTLSRWTLHPWDLQPLITPKAT